MQAGSLATEGIRGSVSQRGSTEQYAVLCTLCRTAGCGEIIQLAISSE